MAGAEKWFMMVDGKTYGPYLSEQLRQFVDEGKAKAETLVCVEGGKQWLHLADAIPELFKSFKMLISHDSVIVDLRVIEDDYVLGASLIRREHLLVNVFSAVEVGRFIILPGYYRAPRLVLHSSCTSY